MNKDLEIIEGRIERLFKRVPRTKYQINIVNDRFDHMYNFFFESQPMGQRLSSVPLHTVNTYDLDYLENLVTELTKQTALSISYTGFVGQRWPSSDKVIQHKARSGEN